MFIMVIDGANNNRYGSDLQSNGRYTTVPAGEIDPAFLRGEKAKTNDYNRIVNI